MLLNNSYNPIEVLMKKIHQLFPRLDDVICFYRTEKELKVELNGKSLQLSTEQKVHIQKIRNTSSNYQWVRPEDFIFLNIKGSNVHQLQLLDEYNNRLLLIHILSPFDQLKDTIAICFPKDVTFFGMQKTLIHLSTDEKSLVGELLQRTLYFDYTLHINQNDTITLLNRYHSLNQKSQVNQPAENYLKSCIQSLFEKFTKKTITFNNDAFSYLIELNIPILNLEPICEKVITLSSLIQPSGDVITISKSMIETVVDYNHTNEFKTQQESQFDKVYDLLERYEEAAQKASSFGEVINGKIVATYLSPPVSPPAISDSIKKNQQKIHSYLQRFPAKWILIRKALKPIRELDYNNTKRSQIG